MQKSGWDLSEAFCGERGAAPLLVGEELVAAASLSKQSAGGPVDDSAGCRRDCRVGEQAW